MQDSADTFEQSTIERLSNAIMLRHVVHSESTLGALLFQVRSEFVACKLTTTV